MKKIFSALITLCFLLPAYGQDTTAATQVLTHKKGDSLPFFIPKRYLVYNYTSHAANNVFEQEFRSDADNRITVDGDYFSSSRGVPAAFVYHLLFNKQISDALRDRVDKNLGNKLKFEESASTGINYEHYFKSADLTLVLGYHYRQMLNLAGPKQSFETIFYGNARFEGDTANLSNIHFDFYNYNQYSIGIIKKIDYGNYQMQLGLSASFLQVIQQVDIQTGNSSIYTAPYGESVDINYDLTFNSATAGAPSYGALNGAGASGDVNIAFQNKDKWKVSLDIRDLGIMSFRKHEVNYSGVNNVNFQGFVIPDLLTFTSQTFDTLNIDSALRSKLPSKSNNQYAIFLPFTANLAFSKPLLHDRLVLTVGVQYRHLPGYYSYGYVKANYFIQPDMVISASAGAGGYSLFDLGVEFAKSWKYFDFAVGSSNLIGLVVPSFYSGSALYLKIGTTF